MNKFKVRSMLSVLKHFTKYSIFKTFHYNFVCKNIVLEGKSFIKIGKGCKINIGNNAVIKLNNSILKLEKGHWDLSLPCIAIINDRSTWEIHGPTTLRGCCLNIQNDSSLSNSKFLVNCLSKINIKGKAVFGNNLLVARNCYIANTNSHKIFRNGKESDIYCDFSIGENVWVCVNSTILKSSKIPSNVIIGAGSVINGELEPNKIVVNDRNMISKDFDSWNV